MNNIKRILTGFAVILIIVPFVAGCKAKRSVATRSPQKPVKVSKQPQYTYDTSEHLYPLPVDGGKFINFTINDADDYIETFAEIAQNEMRAYRIPASITLAQGLLESGNGKGELTRKTNNHFGIKCHTEWYGEYDLHDDDEKGECFRKYNHPMYSFRDHSIFLSTRGRYAFLFNLRTKDYKGWAKGLRKAGYATDPKYPQKLIYLIEKYRLYIYDLGEKKLRKREPREYIVKTHTVEKGETLYAISRMYFMSVPDLMKLNNLKNTTISIGQVLVVKAQKIKTKG